MPWQIFKHFATQNITVTNTFTEILTSLSFKVLYTKQLIECVYTDALTYSVRNMSFLFAVCHATTIIQKHRLVKRYNPIYVTGFYIILLE